MVRTRWAAVGAAVAVSLGAGGIGLIHATSPAGAAAFVPITPCRLFDTRPDFQIGARSAPLGPNDTHTIEGVGAVGECELPTDAVGLVLNVTAVDASQLTFLTFFPAGEEQPNASALNPAPGQPPVPNAATVDLNGDGEFSIYNYQGSVHVLADVVGYYTDHHHDDRYYTEPEVDAALAAKAAVGDSYTKAEADGAIAAAIDTQPWSQPMPISAAHWYDVPAGAASWTIGSGGSDAPTGLTFHDDSYGRFWHGFTLPPEYQAGTDVKLVISWMGDIDNTPGCTFQLEDNHTRATRPGVPYIPLQTQFVGGPAGFPGSFSYVVLTATNEGSPSSFTDNVVQSAELVLSGGELLPGDQVLTAIARRSNPTPATNDSCTGGMTILGLTAEPA